MIEPASNLTARVYGRSMRLVRTGILALLPLGRLLIVGFIGTVADQGFVVRIVRRRVVCMQYSYLFDYSVDISETWWHRHEVLIMVSPLSLVYTKYRPPIS